MSVRPKKGLGQHFLAEPSVVRRIVDAVEAPPGAQVVEIGPGEGAMTGALLARYPSLIALEIDPEAIAHLRQRLPGLDLREGDVLDVDWGALAGASGEAGKGEGGRGKGGNAEPSGTANQDQALDSPTTSPLPQGEGQGEGHSTGSASGEAASHAEPQPPPSAPRTPPRGEGLNAASGAGGEDPASLPIPHPPSLHVAGNLPYYISTPILFALLDARQHIARAVVMVQKEVADRLVAPEGSKTYGTLSVYFALLARAELLFDVPPQAFRPPPKVDSAVVAIDFTDPPEAELDSAALRRVVRAAFGQRRKMLRNSLKGLAEDTGREIPDWAATLRPEQVSPADFVRLTHAFFAP